jgi:hypothetical protein
MTDARASKMHSANAAAAEMSTAAKVAAPAEMGSPAEVAAATAAEVGAPAAAAAAAAATTTSAPSRSRVSCSSQNGRKKNNGESFYPGSFYSGHGTLERPRERPMSAAQWLRQ